MNIINKVSIALQPSVYRTFRALNNTVALTLSEYVDNSVQSYIDNKLALHQNDSSYKFHVSVNVDHINGHIIISDNAAGIDYNNYLRAFQPANIPLDNTSLNEFGMGMKTASVWLADKWSVRTKALGEEVERFVEFDLNKVIEEEKEELVVKEYIRSKKEHYTHIVLTELSHNAPTKNQMDKIRRHLSSIYRVFLRDKEISITINGEELVAPNYDILQAPYFKTPNGKEIIWKKDIDFSLGKYKANGYIAILKAIQNNANGLVLLRRGRVIVGGDERFFPSSIFGSPGNFRYKRLFGELHLEGFDVTFNKNGFIDEDNLNTFIEALREELKDPEFNIFSQADNYRVKTKEENFKIAAKIVKKQKQEKEAEPIELKINNVVDYFSDIKNIEKNDKLISEAEALDFVEDSFNYDGKHYVFKVELINQDDASDLYSVSQSNKYVDGELRLNIMCKINLAHPFFNRFEQFKKTDNYDPIVAIFKSFALAEFIATMKKMEYPSELRTIFNTYIVQSN